METNPVNNSISTGTMTRIVTNSISRMEQNKASLEIFFLIQLLLSLAHNLIFNSECTVTYIMWSVLIITLTLRIPKGKVSNICVKLS